MDFNLINLNLQGEIALKKFIIISGVPRAGKSTISQTIAKRFGYQHISMDSIIAGIETVFPETNIDTEAPIDPYVNLINISSRIAPFIKAMIDSGEYDECDYGAVIDVYQLLPQDYISHLSKENCDIYYFLSSDVTPEERFRLLKLYDTVNDYTYFHSDEEKQQDCLDIVNISHKIKEQCIFHNLPFYETSYNRDEVINVFMHQLAN